MSTHWFCGPGGRTRRERFGASPVQEAMIRAAMGQTDQALDLLEEIGGEHYLKVNPAWEPLQGDPRYERLLEEMGLDDASVQATMARLRAMDESVALAGPSK